MKRQVMDRKASSPQFQKNLLLEFENQMPIEQEEGKENERLETAPHFYIPSDGNELSIADENKTL